MVQETRTRIMPRIVTKPSVTRTTYNGTAPLRHKPLLVRKKDAAANIICSLIYFTEESDIGVRSSSCRPIRFLIYLEVLTETQLGSTV